MAPSNLEVALEDDPRWKAFNEALRRRETNRRPHTEQFLRQLQKQFPISLIYYPGCGSDNVLESAFKLPQIVYLDLFPYNFDNPSTDGRKFFQGDYCQTQFRDESFDALFYQHNEADMAGAIEMLRVLKLGGILIHSPYDCIFNLGIGIEELKRLPGLTEIEMLGINNFHNFTVLQKAGRA